MENCFGPGAGILPVSIGEVVGESEKDESCCQKEPAVFGQPDRYGKTSQTETGQDERNLSAEDKGQGRCKCSALGDADFQVGYHFSPVVMI